jgi:hypothetical protein
MDKTEFWNPTRRGWLYSVTLAGMPILVTLGYLTGEMAGLILNLIAAVLVVGANGMALTHMSPDFVVKFGIALDDEEDEEEDLF